MTLVTLPYNPQPGDPEDITQIMADLQAVLAVLNGDLRNDNVAAQAAIAYSKLNLAASIKNADVAAAAAIVVSKLLQGANGALLKSGAGAAGWTAAPAGAGALPVAIAGLDVGFTDAPAHGERLQPNASGVVTWEPTPGARVYKSAALSIADATTTTLTFDSERFDNGSLHDTVTNAGRITVAVPGLYRAGIWGQWAINNSGARQVVVLHKDSGGVLKTSLDDTRPGVAGIGIRHSIDIPFNCVVGDYFEFQVQQTAGTAINLIACEAWAVKI